jgi:protein required for attachment to host cells
MVNSLGLKLVVVLDINTLKLYEAQGIKINREIAIYEIKPDVNHRSEKGEGFNQKKSTPSSYYDPHTSAKDLEHQESSRLAISYIEQVYQGNADFKELIIVADPKMLGFIRKDLSQQLKKVVVKEISKDLVNHSSQSIEKAIFS